VRGLFFSFLLFFGSQIEEVFPHFLLFFTFLPFSAVGRGRQERQALFLSFLLLLHAESTRRTWTPPFPVPFSSPSLVERDEQRSLCGNRAGEAGVFLFFPPPLSHLFLIVAYKGGRAPFPPSSEWPGKGEET